MAFWLELAENQMNPSSPVENWLVFALFYFRARYFIGFFDLFCLPLFLGQFFVIFHDSFWNISNSGHFSTQFFLTCLRIFQIQVIFPCNFPWPVLEQYKFKSWDNLFSRQLQSLIHIDKCPSLNINLSMTCGHKVKIINTIIIMNFPNDARKMQARNLFVSRVLIVQLIKG